MGKCKSILTLLTVMKVFAPGSGGVVSSGNASDSSSVQRVVFPRQVVVLPENQGNVVQICQVATAQSFRIIPFTSNCVHFVYLPPQMLPQFQSQQVQSQSLQQVQLIPLQSSQQVDQSQQPQTSNQFDQPLPSGRPKPKLSHPAVQVVQDIQSSSDKPSNQSSDNPNSVKRVSENTQVCESEKDLQFATNPLTIVHFANKDTEFLDLPIPSVTSFLAKTYPEALQVCETTQTYPEAEVSEKIQTFLSSSVTTTLSEIPKAEEPSKAINVQFLETLLENVSKLSEENQISLEISDSNVDGNYQAECLEKAKKYLQENTKLWKFRLNFDKMSDSEVIEAAQKVHNGIVFCYFQSQVGFNLNINNIVQAFLNNQLAQYNFVIPSFFNYQLIHYDFVKRSFLDNQLAQYDFVNGKRIYNFSLYLSKLFFCRDMLSIMSISKRDRIFTIIQAIDIKFITNFIDQNNIWQTSGAKIDDFLKVLKNTLNLLIDFNIKTGFDLNLQNSFKEYLDCLANDSMLKEDLADIVIKFLYNVNSNLLLMTNIFSNRPENLIIINLESWFFHLVKFRTHMIDCNDFDRTIFDNLLKSLSILEQEFPGRTFCMDFYFTDDFYNKITYLGRNVEFLAGNKNTHCEEIDRCRQNILDKMPVGSMIDLVSPLLLLDIQEALVSVQNNVRKGEKFEVSNREERCTKFFRACMANGRTVPNLNFLLMNDWALDKLQKNNWFIKICLALFSEIYSDINKYLFDLTKSKISFNNGMVVYSDIFGMNIGSNIEKLINFAKTEQVKIPWIDKKFTNLTEKEAEKHFLNIFANCYVFFEDAEDMIKTTADFLELKYLSDQCSPYLLPNFFASIGNLLQIEKYAYLRPIVEKLLKYIKQNKKEIQWMNEKCNKVDPAVFFVMQKINPSQLAKIIESTNLFTVGQARVCEDVSLNLEKSIQHILNEE